MRCQPEPPSRHRLSPAADGAQALGASLAVDLLSWGSELASRRRRSADETAEIVRRRWQAGLYLLRTPLFELSIRAALLKVGAGLDRLPRWSGGALLEPAPLSARTMLMAGVWVQGRSSAPPTAGWWSSCATASPSIILSANELFIASRLFIARVHKLTIAALVTVHRRLVRSG